LNELDRGRPKKPWWDCVKNDVESLGLSEIDVQFRNNAKGLVHTYMVTHTRSTSSDALTLSDNPFL